MTGNIVSYIAEWIPVSVHSCPDCAGTGWQDFYKNLVCVSCMGRGTVTAYEQRITQITTPVTTFVDIIHEGPKKEMLP